MANKRIYWAVQAVGLSPMSKEDYVEVHGVQSVGLNLNFSLEPIMELGQSEPYQITEDVPEVEMTIEKVLDGYPLAYHLATRGYPENTLLGRQNQRCDAALSLFTDTQSSASGVPVRQLVASGLYFASVSYSFPTDGPATESLTLNGNNLTYLDSNFTFGGALFDNTDEPLSLTSGTGGVQRRQNFLWGPTGSVLPTEIPGINASGHNIETNGEYGAHIQSITVSMDAGREAINELGRLGPYYRYLSLPVEISTEIEVISTMGHSVTASETATSNVTNQTILIKVAEGTVIDLGSRNKLRSVTIQGGDTGGGNQTMTFSYVNWNTFIVTHPQDPVTD